MVFFEIAGLCIGIAGLVLAYLAWRDTRPPR